MDEFYIPTLHSFAMNNSFTGSHGNFRFKITPNVTMRTPKEVDFSASSIRAEYWYGPLCYEKSEIIEEKTFPMQETGRQEMRDWLWQHRDI